MTDKKVADVKTKATSKKNTTKKTSKKPSTVKKAPKEKKVEAVVEEPMADIMEEPKRKINVSRDTLRLVGSIVFWVIFAILAFVWLVDYFRVSRESKPIFCLSNKTHEFEDGTVKECVGLGYKVYTYDRESLGKGVEFGSFFTKMKEPEEN